MGTRPLIFGILPNLALHIFKERPTAGRLHAPAATEIQKMVIGLGNDVPSYTGAKLYILGTKR